MTNKTNQPVIVAARRTPVGRFFGGLSRVPAPQLGAFAIEAVLNDSGIDASSVDECMMGCVLQAGLGQNPARQAALKGGLPDTISAVTINKAIQQFCSGFDEIYDCGGGSKNKFLIERLEKIIGVNINTTDKLNIPSQQVEAVAFAWLAKKCVQKQYNNSHTVTGSSGPRILGTIHYS